MGMLRRLPKTCAIAILSEPDSSDGDEAEMMTAAVREAISGRGDLLNAREVASSTSDLAYLLPRSRFVADEQSKLASKLRYSVRRSVDVEHATWAKASPPLTELSVK